MTSTSLTETAVSRRAPAAHGLRPWQFYLTASFLAAAAAVWLSPPASPVALLFISLAVGAAGACAAALHALLTALSGQTAPEGEVSENLRAALERDRLLTLRAIKDLQFDTAMGKVSAADSAPMEARLRDRAAAIMAQLDSREAVRARVEQDVAKKSAPVSPRATGSGRRTAVACACGTFNDADAKFCKTCGAKL